MARLESAVLTSSATYARNHAAQSERVETLRARIAEATSGGRPDMVKRHRKRGKLLVRERIDLLVLLAIRARGPESCAGRLAS